MPELARRPLLLAALALLTVLALAAAVLASAASLGGLRTDNLGGASARTHQLTDLTLAWTPTWQDGAWRVGDLELVAPSERGFRAGDQVKVTVAVDAAACEVTVPVGGARQIVTVAGAQFSASCGTAPALTRDSSVAVVVTGADDATVFSNLGALSGSLAGFSAAVVDRSRSLDISVDTASVESGVSVQAVRVVVPGVSAADLVGQRLSIALPGSDASQRTGTITEDPSSPVHITGGDASGSWVIFDLSAEPWGLNDSSDVTVALSAAQHLTASSGAPGVTLGQGSVEVEQPAPTPTPSPAGSALEAVSLSAGISYDFTRPWTGARTNVLTYCHRFTVTNTSGAPLTDWTAQFDTRLAPAWGLNPTSAGVIRFDGNLQTRDYDAATGLWTVGGNSAWARQLGAGESRSYQYCADDVPVPPVNPDLFKAVVTVVPNNDWNVTFRVDVTSTSEFYVPWAVEVDFAELVCGTSLQGRSISFTQVTATPIEGSTTRYLIRGIPGNTLLASATHSRSFTFASYGPGPGWQLPCAGGG